MPEAWLRDTASNSTNPLLQRVPGQAITCGRMTTIRTLTFYAPSTPKITPVFGFIMLTVRKRLEYKKQQSSTIRFPGFESVLETGTKLHETWVTCEDVSGKAFRFLIAAQYRADFQVNRALLQVLPEVSWRGGLLVMLGGEVFSVVKMKDRFQRDMTERAVRKYLLETAAVIVHAATDNVPLLLPTEM
ncbi:hypothetical protein C8Q74DRAFT_1373493 [Fomes fomentarius]|nr:hypothetical protein C8Q74DRAFT_1373493 [Fomes fomentarius]